MPARPALRTRCADTIGAQRIFTGMNPNTNPSALDPTCRDMLIRVGRWAAAVPAHELTPQRQRQFMRDSIAVYAPPEARVPAQREDLSVSLPGRSLPARLYWPAAGRPQPKRPGVEPMSARRPARHRRGGFGLRARGFSRGLRRMR